MGISVAEEVCSWVVSCLCSVDEPGRGGEEMASLLGGSAGPHLWVTE